MRTWMWSPTGRKVGAAIGAALMISIVLAALAYVGTIEYQQEVMGY